MSYPQPPQKRASDCDGVPQRGQILPSSDMCAGAYQRWRGREEIPAIPSEIAPFGGAASESDTGKVSFQRKGC